VTQRSQKEGCNPAPAFPDEESKEDLSLTSRKHNQGSTMKLHQNGHAACGSRPLFTPGLTFLLALSAALGSLSMARAQIYVTGVRPDNVAEYNAAGATVNSTLLSQSTLDLPYGIALSGPDLFVTNYAGTIGKYNATTGATINASLISCFTPTAITASGGDLFVVYDLGIVGEYTTSGATVNASLFSIYPYQIYGIAVSGGDIFVTTQHNTIAEYTTSGTLVNASLVSGVSAGYIAVSGGDIFVTIGNSIAEYTTAGALVNAALVTGLNNPNGMAMSGGDLFVANYASGGSSDGSVGEYDATTGAAVNASLVSGMDAPIGLTVNGVPEPSAAALLGLAAAGFIAARRRRLGRCASRYGFRMTDV
jgi:hypothetical protein